MKCGCQNCGAFMDHVEKGEDSYCVCPVCLHECRDCMGGNNPRFHMISKEQAQSMKEYAKNSKLKKWEKGD